MFTPMLLGTALFLYVMEMWARTHPDPEMMKKAPVDTVAFVDRFEVKDSGVAVPSVDRYLAFVAQSGSNGGLIHNYINRGLRILNQAQWGVANLSVKVGETDRMQLALSRYIDSLETHPRWSLDPHKVVPGFLMALEIMESQNVAHDAETRRKIQRAREAALALLQGPSTLWQRARVQEFFIRAGIALVAVKNRAARPAAASPAGLTADQSPAEPRPEEGAEAKEPETPRIPVRPDPQPPPPKLIFGKP